LIAKRKKNEQGGRGGIAHLYWTIHSFKQTKTFRFEID
jgi:hypothetical protein